MDNGILSYARGGADSVTTKKGAQSRGGKEISFLKTYEFQINTWLNAISGYNGSPTGRK